MYARKADASASKLATRIVLSWLLLACLASPWVRGRARADTPARSLPASVVSEVLEDPQPTAFAPADFDTRDFRVERAAGADPSISAHLEAGSIEWVRTAAWVVVPRAVLVVDAPGASGGSVQYAGASHALSRGSDHDAAARALVPIVLIAGATHPVRVTALHDGTPLSAAFHVRFAPRPENRGLVLFDTRCSPFGLRAARGAIAPDSFLYVGCNNVVTQRGEHDSATLGMYLLWEQADAVTIGGVAASASADDVLYVHRVTGGAGSVELRARDSHLELAYVLPEPARAGFLGVGFGPYYYRLDDDRSTRETGAPMLTLYGGYVVNPTMRIVYFNATMLERHGYMDQGVYLSVEQFRMLDERLSVVLLLGANALVYVRHEALVGRFSAPQGFELVFRDFLGRNRNLTAGAFLYPSIDQSSYYNVWLRWGSGAFFGELNYIAWEEPGSGGPSKSQSLGVSFGTPVARFLRFL